MTIHQINQIRLAMIELRTIRIANSADQRKMDAALHRLDVIVTTDEAVKL